MSAEKRPSIEQLKLDYSVIENPNFQEACEVARQNTSGNLWVIGGYLARAFSNTDTSKGDIDFLADHLNENLSVPNEKWKGRKRQLFPGLKFDREDGLSVDISELGSWKNNRGLPPTPETFLKLAPFTHMAIMYDVKNKILVGEAGIKSMLNHQTSINNLAEAEEYARTVEKYSGMSIKEILEQKAAELNFKAI